MATLFSEESAWPFHLGAPSLVWRVPTCSISNIMYTAKQSHSPRSTYTPSSQQYISQEGQYPKKDSFKLRKEWGLATLIDLNHIGDISVFLKLLNQGSPDIIYLYIYFCIYGYIKGIGLNVYGGQKVPWSAVWKLESQESWWCSSHLGPKARQARRWMV